MNGQSPSSAPSSSSLSKTLVPSGTLFVVLWRYMTETGDESSGYSSKFLYEISKSPYSAWLSFNHSRALPTALRLTRKGVRARSFGVGLQGPVNKIARTSSRSSKGGGRAL